MDNVFPFVATLMDKAIEYTEKAQITSIHSQYSALIILVKNRQKLNALKAAEPISSSHNVAEVKRLAITRLSRSMRQWTTYTEVSSTESVGGKYSKVWKHGDARYITV